MNLDSLKPTRKDLVFDLVKEAGFDVTDWIASSRKPNAFKANPAYCYNWSFVQPGRVVILNLWFATMRLEDGRIVQHNNFREDARGNAGHNTWVRRATKLDQALQQALREGLQVRVIVNDGIMRDRGNPRSRASEVLARQLDPEFWTIASYDWDTGQNTLVRGILEPKFVDQFDDHGSGADMPESITISAQVFKRNRDVRRQALARAAGSCEFCGEAGFRTHSGAIYLETHHIVPLCEGGPDKITNVVALCPNDHKKAHHSFDRHSMKQKLLERIRK